jgi:AcrR family transcriptional regulator
MTCVLEGLVGRLDNVYTANVTIDDNTVNIEDKKARYHHGDLRAALIEEGLRELADGAAGDLSLRAIARKVGVSATAVYRHFPDKTALLAALCAEGDRLLGEVSRRAQQTAGGGRAGFDATGRAYVRFALEHPALFRMMMARFRGVPGDPGASESAGLRLLVDNIAALSSPDVPPAERKLRALQSWALVHGLAMLMLDGIVPADDALIDAVIVPPFADRSRD